MKTVVVGTQYPEKEIPLRGTYFYAEELAQYWYDQIDKNIEVCLTRSGASMDERYTWVAPRFNKEESECGVLVVNWVHDIKEIDHKLFESARVVLFVNSANLDSFLRKCFIESLELMDRIRKKSYLLLEPGFETKTLSFSIFNDRVIPIRRGFYFKYYTPPKLPQTQDWFLYSNDYITYEKETHVSNRKVIIAKNYCKQNNIPYVHDKYESANPGNYYSGMLYTRFMDYMPRLPYEFWHYKKPVVLCDISDGLAKRGITEDMKYTPQLLDEDKIPTWNFENVWELLSL